MIPIYVVSIYGEELAKGFAGIATGAALTLVLYGLFAAAQSAAGFKDGVVNLDGAGDDRSDSIPARLSKGESVITAKATKNNMPELTFMNQTGLPLSEFYKRNLVDVRVGLFLGMGYFIGSYVTSKYFLNVFHKDTLCLVYGLFSIVIGFIFIKKSKKINF